MLETRAIASVKAASPIFSPIDAVKSLGLSCIGLVAHHKRGCSEGMTAAGASLPG